MLLTKHNLLLTYLHNAFYVLPLKSDVYSAMIMLILLDANVKWYFDC